MQPQKGEPLKRSKVQQEADQAMLDDLAHCVIEALNIDSQDEEEPFERYSHQLKMRLYQDEKSIRHRFVQGYEILLERLYSEGS